MSLARLCAVVFASETMPCYHPLQGFKSRDLTKNGKRKLVFSGKNGYVDLPVTVSCGQCIGCRIERSRQWALRCVHEAQMHELSCFVTLTYDDEHLPPGGTLVKSHFQSFMKRLRKLHGKPIRYFHCGEYGETSNRPHYHALLYGIDFSDKKTHSKNRDGDQLFTSETLQKTWGFGHCLIGRLNFKTAAYTARYIFKKVTGDDAEKHYQSIDLSTGEIIQRLPEYITMSLKPAIGATWYRKFASDVFPSDFLVHAGKKMLPPRYYFRVLEHDSPELHRRLKFRRISNAAQRKSDSTPERLAVRKTVKLSQLSSLKRTL